jgi:hypothetical protein
LPDTGEPQIFNDTCEQIAVSFEDQIFTVVPDACYKIVRHWTIINWCTYPAGAGQDVFADHQGNEDTDAPIFTIAPIDGCILDTDCDKDLVLPYPDISDECSLEFTVKITGDFGTFSNISGAVTVPNVGWASTK